MQFKYLFSLALAVVSSVMVRAEDKKVFAHFMVGNAANMQQSDWVNDITLAKNAGIDGFALNIATQDSYTDTVLQNAFNAVQSVPGFVLFLSFDYASGGPWAADQVVSTINSYKNNGAYYKYNGQPFVSTFEGTNNINDWSGIKQQTGCFLVPDWSSLGPQGFGSEASVADGGFSWDAWPEGASDMDDSEDQSWMSVLGNRPYMMPASPWFYTNLPQWNKNWLWRGADLWHDRWQQIIELQPALVEIITWNDYGESHYIGPIYQQGIPQGAGYVDTDHAHEGWLAILPEYIAAYKNGNSTLNGSAAAGSDTATVWYKTTPGNAGNADGTTGNNPGQGQTAVNPVPVSVDSVFFTVSVKEPSDVTLQIGGSSNSFRATTAGINHFSSPMNGATGAVTVAISRNGAQIASVTGPAITTQCPDGNVNWNAVCVSSAQGGGSSNTTAPATGSSDANSTATR